MIRNSCQSKDKTKEKEPYADGNKQESVKFISTEKFIFAEVFI